MSAWALVACRRDGRRRVDEHVAAKSPTDGYTIVEDAIEPELVDALADDLAAPRAVLRRANRPPNSFEGHAHAPHLQPARATASCTSAIPVHEHVLPVVEGVLDPGCLVSSLSSIAILPGRDGAADPRRRPADPAPEAAPADRLQLDVGAHRLHRGERRDAASSRARTSATTRPTTAAEYDSIAGRDAEGQRARSGTAACGTAAARTRTDRARVGIAMNYCAGCIRQQENQQLGLPREIVDAVLAAAARARRLRRLQRAHRPHQQALARGAARSTRRRPRRADRGADDGVGRHLSRPPHRRRDGVRSSRSTGPTSSMRSTHALYKACGVALEEAAADDD